MTDLDTIKNSIDINSYLSDDVKANLFELIVLFNKNFKEVALDNLNKRIKDLKIERISSYCICPA